MGETWIKVHVYMKQIRVAVKFYHMVTGNLRITFTGEKDIFVLLAP